MIDSVYPTGERFALLYRISQAFNSTLDMDEVLNRVMDEVITATKAERGFVVTLENKRELIFRAARGVDHNALEDPERQISRSIVEQVLNSCEAVLTQNALGDTRFSGQSSVRNLKLVSILCVPLMCRGSVKGVIYVENRIQSGIFSEHNLELLTAIAANAGVALENAQLFQNLREQLQTLNLLYEISADLTSQLNLEQLLTSTLQRVQDVLAAPAASLLTAEGDELVFQVALGERAEEIKPFRIPADQGIAGWVLQNGEGVIVDDVNNDNRFYKQADAKSGFTTQSIIAAPLLIKDRAIGVIELFNKVGGFTETDLALLTAIASTAAIAIDNARLYQEAVDKGRMERELQMALTVQTGLLPHKIPQFEGWDFAAHWQPAREVSGDYYDFIHLDSSGHTLFTGTSSLGLVIADVTDKGMPAALFMAFTRSVIRASVHQADSPADGITHANTLICDDSTRGLFVTVFYAQLSQTTGQLTYVNAGHNPPLHYRAAQGTIQRLMPTGISVGIVDDFQFKQDHLTLEPGDFLLCYTDGITEAINPDEQAFGIARLEEVVLAHKDKSADELASTVEQAVNEFCGPGKQFDDMTILVVRNSKIQ